MFLDFKKVTVSSNSSKLLIPEEIITGFPTDNESYTNIHIDRGKQLEDIAKGNITEYEYEAAQKSIETGIKSIKDSQLQLVDFYLSQYITKSEDTPDMVIEKVKNASIKDVADIALKVKLDTIYFITNNEKEI